MRSISGIKNHYRIPTNLNPMIHTWYHTMHPTCLTWQPVWTKHLMHQIAHISWKEYGLIPLLWTDKRFVICIENHIHSRTILFRMRDGLASTKRFNIGLRVSKFGYIMHRELGCDIDANQRGLPKTGQSYHWKIITCISSHQICTFHNNKLIETEFLPSSVTQHIT